MKITVMTMWYNEEFLAPFFLEHYKFADRIHVIMDADTNDKSREIASKYPNVTMEEYKFPDGMNDILRRDKFNQTAQTLDTDWLFIADADEFFFAPNDVPAKEYLKQADGNVLFAWMWYVFRNVKDKDLDFNILPIHHQRRYGSPKDRMERSNLMYNTKPVIIHMPLDFKIGIGSHTIEGKGIKFGNLKFDGAHWSSADPAFCLHRRVHNRKNRHSQINRQNGFGVGDFNITEKEIWGTYVKHLNDPQLF